MHVRFTLDNMKFGGSWGSASTRDPNRTDPRVRRFEDERLEYLNRRLDRCVAVGVFRGRLEYSANGTLFRTVRRTFSLPIGLGM